MKPYQGVMAGEVPAIQSSGLRIGPISQEYIHMLYVEFMPRTVQWCRTFAVASVDESLKEIRRSGVFRHCFKEMMKTVDIWLLCCLEHFVRVQVLHPEL